MFTWSFSHLDQSLLGSSEPREQAGQAQHLDLSTTSVQIFKNLFFFITQSKTQKTANVYWVWLEC